MMSRLQTYYKETVVPQLMEQMSFTNVMEVPKITKITLNMGVGEAVEHVVLDCDRRTDGRSKAQGIANGEDECSIHTAEDKDEHDHDDRCR